MLMTSTTRPSPWTAIRPSMSGALSDVRLQAHHAAQLVSAVGISYLPTQPDDSHTNLEWVAARGSLFARPVPTGRAPFRVGLRVRDLTLLVLGGEIVNASMPLNGRTINHAATWLESELEQSGLDSARFTLAKHYEIPPHPVATGTSFDTRRTEHFGTLSACFANAAVVFDEVRRTTGASEVRCWPHHFDLAMLITHGVGKTIGIGMEPGDGSYDEPYFYVNMYPYPPSLVVREQPLDGGGIWHTEGWTGAVLLGSALKPSPVEQEAQVKQFLASAIQAAKGLLV
jgi:hypothetical protein